MHVTNDINIVPCCCIGENW